jgi:hypothetical protein
MYGFDMRELGFYYLEGGNEEDDMIPPNSTTLFVLKGSLAVESLTHALKELINDQWDWQIHRIAHDAFAVVFPSANSVCFTLRSTFVPLLDDVEVKAGPLVVDPDATTWLLETRIRVRGIPAKLRQEPTIKEMLSVVGRVVDIESISPDRNGWIVAKIWCQDPSKIKGRYEIFKKKAGFVLIVEAEGG